MHFFLHSSLENFLSGASCRYCQTHSIVNNYFFRCNSMGCMADGWLTCPQPASLQKNAPDTTNGGDAFVVADLPSTSLITKKRPGHYNARQPHYNAADLPYTTKRSGHYKKTPRTLQRGCPALNWPHYKKRSGHYKLKPCPQHSKCATHCSETYGPITNWTTSPS